jgi:hypothetical protein
MSECVDRGILRAYLDDELPADVRRGVEVHLDGCPACRQTLDNVRQTAALVRSGLDRVAPAHLPNVAGAVERGRRDKAMTQQQLWYSVRRSYMSTSRWRPVLAGVLVLALLVGVFSVAPSRALARQVLSIFRVRRFAVIQVSPDQATMDELGTILQESLLTREPEILVDGPEARVETIAEASEIAGFAARMPAYLPDSPQSAQIWAKGRSELRLTVPRQGLEAVLALAGMDGAALPAEMDEATIDIVVPGMVTITKDHVQIQQVFAPEINYPDGVDPRLYGEAGLRLMGLDAREARRISERIDWTSTLILPVPTEVAEIREIEVAGVPAVLVRPRQYEGSDMNTLLFEKDGVLYAVNARYGDETLLQIAESMF